MTYDAAAYGDAIADVYDAWLPPAHASATVQAAATLTELADGGRVLELGVGTGRLAVPLADAGLQVHGIDASQAMLDRLAEKPGGAGVTGHLGDFAGPLPAGPYSLVFVAFNTFFALLTQDEQVACFEHVAGVLTADGSFVLECFVPDLTLYDHGQRVSLDHMRAGEVRISTSTLDVASQRVSTTHIALEAGVTRFVPVELRYAWPAELDLMARLAGLTLRERWGGWGYEPFGPTSSRHVSVYTR